MLSDLTIQRMMQRKEIEIEPGPENPMDPSQFQPVSVDLRLGRILTSDGSECLGPKPYELLVNLAPGEFFLGSTIEHIKLSNNVAGIVHGKSTRARQGLIVHAAGLVDPGFEGQLTLEMFNMSSIGIELSYGMLICQISFSLLSTSPERAYGHPALRSRYQGQTGPTPARL